MATVPRKVLEVVPAAGRTVDSLRDIGYELPQAVADLVDNSIEASATNVHVDLFFDGADSWIRIADNGTGMDSPTLTESFRLGSTRDYAEDDLGKFGFGLKTASLSQCRRFVVASRIALERARVEVRVFDLDHIVRTNRWEIFVLDPQDRPRHLTEPLKTTTGTVVLWENLDRILVYKDPGGHWAKNRMLEMAETIAEHLAMVFHRFLSGTVRGGQKVEIYVNGSHVEPWDPFCREEASTDSIDPTYYPLVSEGRKSIVSLHPFVLPGQSQFSSSAAWTRASGPNKWNNQQGLYIYRSDRLVQWGGWNRLRTNDEHTKLARVSLDFSSDLDAAFEINISKAIVKIPADLREAILPSINQVCRQANERYRNNSREGRRHTPSRPMPQQTAPAAVGSSTAQKAAVPSGYGLPPLSLGASTTLTNDTIASGRKRRAAIEAAAAEAGEGQALERIVSNLNRLSPEVARELGW